MVKNWYSKKGHIHRVKKYSQDQQNEAKNTLHSSSSSSRRRKEGRQISWENQVIGLLKIISCDLFLFFCALQQQQLCCVYNLTMMANERQFNVIIFPLLSKFLRDESELNLESRIPVYEATWCSERVEVKLFFSL